MALPMALLLSVKFHKSDEWLIIHNETRWHLSLRTSSNEVTLVSISAVIEIKAHRLVSEEVQNEDLRDIYWLFVFCV